MFWRYGFNFIPTVQYKFGAANKLGAGEQRKALDALNRDGIAVSTVGDLLDDAALFSEMKAAVGEILDRRGAELNKIKSSASDELKIGAKTFNVELLGSEIEFDPNSVFARFALQEKILDIANSYLGMIAKLRYYNVWQTFATDAAFRESQLWHYDREDNYILKIFLYLKDVTEGGGPFTYAPQTHLKGARRGSEPEYFLEKNVRRSTDEQMAAAVPEDQWIKGTGKTGTIIFADTRGFHKGGEARTDDRLMYTCMFTSAASESKRLISYPKHLNLADLSRKQLLALENQRC